MSNRRVVVNRSTGTVRKASTPTRNLNRTEARYGYSGLKRSNGIVQEEFLVDLHGPNGIKIYKEMRDNNAVIGAVFFAIEMFMRRVKWFVDPATEDDQGQANATFLRECMDDMSQTWADFISEVMSMMQYGWSWHEILYKIRSTTITDEDTGDADSKFNDGRYGWKAFEVRSQDSFERWDFDELSGNVRGLWQRPAPTYSEFYIPIQKSLLFRTSTNKNNPEGRSVLRNAYISWYYLKRIQEIEGIGIERDIAGIPMVELPAEMFREDASDDDKKTVQSFIDLVKNVRNDEQAGIILPQARDEKGNKLYEFSLLSSGGPHLSQPDVAIARYKQEIAQVVLADFIMLGTDRDSAGSFALATSKSGLFQSALSSWLDVIQNVLNTYAVPRLFRLNNIDGPYPKFRHDDVQKPSLNDMAVFIAALAGAGAQLFPDIDLENHFRQLAQLPLREADPADMQKEDLLRGTQMDAQIEGAKAAIKAAKSGVVAPQGTTAPTPLGKQPGTVPGAPTKTTGPVKSKLPPSNRRSTASTRAAVNTTQKRGVS